ncbi:hypothetical protein, partial [Streptomyces rhizosphaericola]
GRSGRRARSVERVRLDEGDGTLQPVTELRVRRRRLVRSAIRTAGPDGGPGQSNAYASTSDR